MNGQIINQVKENGAKDRGYIYANGVVIAKQIYNNYGQEQVDWEHYDSSGRSLVSTTKAGYVAEISRAELNQLGNDVGVEKPEVRPTSLIKSSPQDNQSAYAVQNSGACPIDGIETSCTLRSALGEGTFASRNQSLPFEMTGNTPRNPNNPLAINNDIRNGIFPDSSQISGINPYGFSDGRRRIENIGEANYDSQYLNYLVGDPFKRQLDNGEVTKLKELVTTLYSNTNCQNFINKILLEAAKFAPPNRFYDSRLIEGDPTKIFEKVEKDGGFYFDGNSGFSSISGTLLYGNPDRNGQIITAENDRPKVLLQTSQYYYPRGPQDPQSQLFPKVVTEIRKAKLFNISDGGITVLHELLHFNFHDLYLAQAVAKLNGDIKTKFPTMGQATKADIDFASDYWDTELLKNCDPKNPNFIPNK